MTAPRPSSTRSTFPLQAFLLDSVDSTNDTGKRYVRDGTITSHAYVLADEQTGGKGNRGRRWLSPRGAGIYVSVVDVTPCAAVPVGTLFTLAAGVACAEVLRAMGDVDVRLKPINDLYVAQKKLGGILTELLIEAGQVRTVVTGIGLNTRSVPRDVSGSTVEPVSLEDVVGAAQVAKMLDGDLVVKLVRNVLSWNDICRANDVARVRAGWESLCVRGGVFPESDA